KKRLNIQNKRRKGFVKKTATIAATTLLLTMPINSTIGKLGIPGVQTQEVSAATIGEVNLLQSANVTALENAVNDYSLSVSGQALANVEVLGPDRIAVFQLDFSSLPQEIQDQVEIVSVSNAQVSVDLTAFNMSDLPAL